MTINVHNYSISGQRDVYKDNGEACPIPTQVPELNAKNRDRALKIAGYGMPKAGTTSLCGNCKVFNVKESMLECIDKGLPVENPMEAGDRGYCEAFHFACSASHTCNAWVEGGPIEDEEESNIKIELEIEIPMDKAAKPKVGDFVRWDSNNSVAQGKIERVVTDGVINVPDSSFEVKGTPEEPALLIRIYRQTAEGWSKTDRLGGHKASTVRAIKPLK